MHLGSKGDLRMREKRHLDKYFKFVVVFIVKCKHVSSALVAAILTWHEYLICELHHRAMFLNLWFSNLAEPFRAVGEYSKLGHSSKKKKKVIALHHKNN